jgi:glycerol-3-phosphate acyltransferase PlsY
VPAALGSFLLDASKGMVALALFGGSPWAALGVYAGHLYPLPRWRGELPRGRGNGVLLGILAGLWAFMGVPFGWTLVPLLVYAALLAGTRYVALATTAGLLTLPLLAFGAPPSYLPAALGLTVLGWWRHKVSLTRILDGTETKIGDPLPVRG